MRGFQYIFQEGLGKGLRRFSSNPRNLQSLVECHNAMPAEEGLRPHVDITSLNADDISWGGEGKLSAFIQTRSITINIIDYVDYEDLANSLIYIDDIYVGTTDVNGELDLAEVAVGTHVIKITKDNYVDSDDDRLLNDTLVVT
jgi:hypothetical protein